MKLEEIIQDCETCLRASNCELDKWTKEKMTDLLQSYYDFGRLTTKQENFLLDAAYNARMCGSS